MAVRAPPAAARSFDFAYDPVYTLSSERDQARVRLVAQTTMQTLVKVPHYATMFSSLPHRPAYSLRLEARIPQPALLMTAHRPGRETMCGNEEVRGRSRYRFFQRPHIPFLLSHPVELILQQPRVVGEEHGVAGIPAVRSVSVQTDFRDSETQTEPFSPPYIVPPGVPMPEILTLTALTHERGLPAGLAEVEMIERLRARRAWEESLPSLHDAERRDQRRRLMEEAERREWAFREREIHLLQEERVRVLEELLWRREHGRANAIAAQVDVKRRAEEELRREAQDVIRRQHLRSVRKLVARWVRVVEGAAPSRDVIHDYTDPASRAFAPLTRLGQFTKTKHGHPTEKQGRQVQPQLLNSYHGLLELESCLPASLFNVRVSQPKMEPRAARQMAMMDEAYKALRERREMQVSPPLRFLEQVEKPEPRPPTPTTHTSSQEEDKRELAAIFLQKLLRGRSTQNEMFEQKELRLELIREVRSTHALQAAEQAALRATKQATLALQRQHAVHQNQVEERSSVLSACEGSALSHLLLHTAQELERLQVERRLHAACLLAERRRRRREATEGGRRQHEERARREHDEVFKQVVGVHQATVDEFLESVLLNAMESTSEAQARLEVQILAEQLDEMSRETQHSLTPHQAQEVVAELVHGFLIPETQRREVREKVKAAQRRHLAAAHGVVLAAARSTKQSALSSASASSCRLSRFDM
ncbi:unnamed protein product [Lampetra fluviatilis]